MTPQAAPNTAAPPSRRPKSELDREIKLMRQIESRWRQLHRHGQELVVERLTADLTNQENHDDG